MTSAAADGQPKANSKRVTKMASTQSLNHLLNFTLPPRQTYSTPLPRRSRKPAAHQAIWNQERFVNAQYRFVMDPTESYTVHFADPDIFLQWRDILQVIIPRSSIIGTVESNRAEGHTSCPICLSSPIAPRMTKCGHVFCFPCILHYLNTSEDKRWIRCPICFDAINERQLKSVKWHDAVALPDNEPDALSSAASSSIKTRTPASSTRAGSWLRMRLMQRPQITTLALPRSPSWPSDLIPPHHAPFHFLPDVYNFAKFMLATPAYLIDDLTVDLDGLAIERVSLVEARDDLGLFFLDEAVEKVKTQIAMAAALESPQLKQAIDKTRRDQLELKERVSYHRERLAAAQSAPALDVPTGFAPSSREGHVAIHPYQSAGAITSHTPSSSRCNKPRRNLNPPPPSTSTYYFYQAASGLPIFLHPLDIRILFSHFNGYASFPDTIAVYVEALADGTVNDDLRKRCKYLGHMPEGADVTFVEADLKGVVGGEALKAFEGPLKMRRSKRKEKERKDDRARARAEERDREKERETLSAAWGSASRAASAPVPGRSSSPTEPVPPPEPPTQPAGVWGTRSFASALHASPNPRGGAPRRVPPPDEDEWGIDAAWHELERGDGARKKRGSRLVVLTGSGGRRR